MVVVVLRFHILAEASKQPDPTLKILETRDELKLAKAATLSTSILAERD